LGRLNALEYYSRPYPKSLDNSFGIDVVYPLLKRTNNSVEGLLCTYTEHICIQINSALDIANTKLLVTGGGAFNDFLMLRLKKILSTKQIELTIPDEKLIKYKEALIMALIGVLRWRGEPNVLASVTGASYDSIGGALWLGFE
jgi:anhydro-N-acetylmuramic acid kinase